MEAAWTEVITKNSLLTAFAFVGVVIWFSYFLSAKLTRGHLHGSAVAIAIGLALAWAGGAVTGGENGLAATDPKLVPYGAMTATFYTGVGCLLAPSVLFLAVRGLYG
jgi:hypothetical protein